jgi:serine/threonine-protein kinase
MAPEQLRGDVTRVSDVYAASVVLWEALTGKRLFRGDNEAHVFEQVLKGCQEPPSAYAPGLPSALDAVTMRGLSVDPALRFTTAREMACALEEAITPATASKIGDWVERAAKTTLDERTARIASIESDSSVQAPRVPPSSPDLPRSLREAPNQMIPVILADGSGITQLSSGSISSPARKSSRGASLRARPRTAWLVGVCGVFFLGGAFALGKGMSGAVPAAPASPAPQPLASAADPVPPAPSTPSADPGIDVASPREDGTDLPSPQTSKGAASAVPAGANLKPVLPITRAPRAPTVNCDPPYTINAAGHRVRKPECH